jgi:hypothetical protein
MPWIWEARRNSLHGLYGGRCGRCHSDWALLDVCTAGSGWRIKDWHRWFLNSWLFKVDLPSIRPSTSLNHLYTQSITVLYLEKWIFCCRSPNNSQNGWPGDLLQGVEALLCGKVQNWEQWGLAGIQSGCFRLPKKQFGGSHRLDFGKWFQTLHGSIGHTRIPPPAAAVSWDQLRFDPPCKSSRRLEPIGMENPGTRSLSSNEIDNPFLSESKWLKYHSFEFSISFQFSRWAASCHHAPNTVHSCRP